MPLPQPSSSTNTSARALDVKLIVRAGCELAKDGWENVSIRQVARHLGRAPTSLYRHVANLDDLQQLVVLDLLDSLNVADHGDDWQRTLTEAAVSIRQWLRTYPGILPAVIAHGSHKAELVVRLEVVISALAVAGLTAEQQASGHATFYSFVFGSMTISDAIIHVAGNNPLPAPAVPETEGTFPNAERSARTIPAALPDMVFAQSLDVLIQGFAALGAANAD